MHLKIKAERICKLLMDEYGGHMTRKRFDPIDELILTILSQNTTDVTAYRAFTNLKSKYENWEDVMSAARSELADAIRVSGFFNIKAERIQTALIEICDRIGELNLAHLKDMPLDEAKHWLTSLHGVGPKTAAIVLLFSFGRAALPVDTHVWRITKRLGLIEDNVSREKAHVELEMIIPEHCVFSLNQNLVRHGRTVCRARRPLCNKCILIQYCDYFSRLKSFIE